MNLYVATKEWDCPGCQGIVFAYDSTISHIDVSARCIYCNCNVVIALDIDNFDKLNVDENTFSFIKKLGV